MGRRDLIASFDDAGRRLDIVSATHKLTRQAAKPKPNWKKVQALAAKVSSLVSAGDAVKYEDNVRVMKMVSKASKMLADMLDASGYPGNAASRLRKLL